MTGPAPLAPFTLPDDGDVPPLPQGFALDPQPAAAPPANDDAPPLPAGFTADAAPSPDRLQVGDAPDQVASRMAPEDNAVIERMLRAGDADSARSYAHHHGFEFPNAEQLVAFYKAHPNVPSTGEAYQLPAATSTGVQAFGDGLSQGASLGTSDEIHGVLNGIGALAHGGSFGDTYDRTVDQDRAQLGADERDHYGLSLAGNVAGGIALPLGLERTGLTASARAVGVAARDAAIASGSSIEAADKIAAQAITHRLAAEGAAYGGAYGAGSSDGTPSQRLLAGVEGAGLGGVIGGVAPMVASGIGKAVRGGYDALTGSVTKAGAVRSASDILRNNAVEPIENIVNNIANRPEPVTGSRPTLAEVAGDAGLAGLQRGTANSNPMAGAAVSERLAQNAMARTAFADDALGAGNAQAIQDVAAGRVAGAQAATASQQAERAATAEQRIATLRSGAQSDLADAQQSVATGRAAIGPDVDRTATGSQARAAFDDAYAGARGRTREAYAHPALQAEHPVDVPKSVFDGIIQTAHDFYGNGGGEMPPAMQSILGDLAEMPANTRTLTNIDRRLADVAGAAQVQGKRSEAAFANRVRGTLGSYVQDAAPQEYRDALATAKAARAEQGRVFETGDAPKAFALDRYGNPTVGDTTVPSKLVRPGAPGGDTADGLIAAIGPEQAENTVRQELRRAVDEGGITTEAQARSLATRYGEVAKRFPAVRSDLDALIAHTGRLDAAASAARDADRATVTTAEKAHLNELSAAEQAINASPLSRIADPAQDPTTFVGNLLRRGDGGRMLSRLASDVSDNPEAVSGLRRAMGQYIVDAGAGVRNTAAGDDIPALAKTRKAIATITTRAGDLLTPQQKIALQRVGKELKSTNFAMNAGRPSGSDTAMNQSYKTMLHFAPLGPHMRALKAVHSAFTSVFTNREQIQHLITQAILDPDFAATLLKRPTASHLDAARTRLLGRKAVISSTLIAQQPLKQAAQ